MTKFTLNALGVGITLTALLCSAQDNSDYKQPAPATHKRHSATKIRANQPLVIQITPQSKQSADKVIRLIWELESTQAGHNIEISSKKLADLQSELGNSDINKLLSVQNYLIVWQQCIGVQAGTFVEEISDNVGANYSKTKKLCLSGQLEGKATTLPVPQANAQGIGNASFDESDSFATNSTGGRIIKFQGGLNDTNLLKLRAESRIAIINDLNACGFGKSARSSDIIGKWSWRWTSDGCKATVNFNLKSDHEMEAKLLPDDPNCFPGKGWVDKGWGNWSIDDGNLSIHMEKVGVWPFGLANPVTFIDDRKILWFDEDLLILDGDTDSRLERIQ